MVASPRFAFPQCRCAPRKFWSLDFIRVICFKSEYRRISRVDTLLGSNGCLLTIVFTKKSTNLNIDYQRSQRRTTLLSFTLSTVPAIFCMKIIVKSQIYTYILSISYCYSKKEKVKTFLPCHHYWSAGPGVDLAQSQEDCQCCCCNSWF